MMLRQTRNSRRAAEYKNPADEIPFSSTKKNDNTKPELNAENIKKQIDQFNANYDDSSDEEEIENKINHYDIEKNWQRLSRRPLKKALKDTLNNDELLSFVAHAAGIKLFYSTNVNKQYYPLKKNVLSEKKSFDNSISQLQLLIQTAVIDSLKKSFDSLSIFLSQSEQKEFTQEQYILWKNDILTEHQQEIGKILPEHLVHFIKWIKMIKFTTHHNRPVGIDEFEKYSTILLKNIFIKHFQLKKSHQDRQEIKHELLALAQKKVDSISKSLLLDKLDNAPGKEKALDAIEKADNSYQALLKFIKQLILKNPARGIVHNMLMREVENPKSHGTLLKTYVSDVISISKLESLQDNERAALTNYLSVNEESVFDELLQGFQHFQKSSLENAMNSLRRPTLGEFYLFKSNNPYSFHANLRLANRSQTREINNLQCALFRSDKSARFWHLADFSTNVPSVFEVQEILKSSFGRRDMVFHLGNYATVYDEIKQIKLYFGSIGENITDKNIAQWIRDIFKGTPPTFTIPETDEIEIVHKLQAITYLILGCETTRNPAMHIINQMLLDLIISNNEWSFEEALTGSKNGKSVNEKWVKRMPMAPEGAVAVARHLMADYRDFMPYPYVYRGSLDRENNKFNKQDLIKYEAKIIRDWVQLTNNESEKLSNPSPDELLKYIEKHYEAWLGSTPIVDSFSIAETKDNEKTEKIELKI